MSLTIAGIKWEMFCGRLFLPEPQLFVWLVFCHRGLSQFLFCDCFGGHLIKTNTQLSFYYLARPVELMLMAKSMSLHDGQKQIKTASKTNKNINAFSLLIFFKLVQHHVSKLIFETCITLVTVTMVVHVISVIFIILIKK